MLLDDILDEDTLLERVDAFSIYSFYIGAELELGSAYSSPLHEDAVPSFALFNYGNNLFYKDHALGSSGTVTKFVQELFSYPNKLDAMSRINVDFELGLLGGNPTITKDDDRVAQVNLTPKIKAKLLAIKILSAEQPSKEFLVYWRGKYGISKGTLDMYHATEPEYVQYFYDNGRDFVIYPKELTVAYRIATNYKIYTPLAEDKKLKFLNNYPTKFVEGYLQLQYRLDFLIITKATKEIMFYREHFDWDSVAGKSENTMIRRHIMLKLVQEYKYIFIWLDNDVAGQRATKAYLEEYPFLIPIFYEHEEKDPTDAYELSFDREDTLNEIKQLVYDTRRSVKRG